MCCGAWYLPLMPPCLYLVYALWVSCLCRSDYNAVCYVYTVHSLTYDEDRSVRIFSVTPPVRAHKRDCILKEGWVEHDKSRTGIVWRDLGQFSALARSTPLLTLSLEYIYDPVELVFRRYYPREVFLPRNSGSNKRACLRSPSLAVQSPRGARLSPCRSRPIDSIALTRRHVHRRQTT